MDSPPRAPPVKYKTPLGTRWQKEKASAEAGAFEYPEDAKFVGPWIIGECVGKGASGHVKIAKHRRTGQLAAVKILPLQPFVSSRASLELQAKSEKQRLGIDREITMMKLMNHPNIMRIYDVYEGDRQLYLILEYVEGGELFDFLVNRGKLGPLEALGYFKQIVYGLNYAHTFSIIHRDLKPENILIHSLNPPLIKIADWGMAAFAPPSLQLETSCGSPHYASPEIVNGHKYTGTATDIWSCGVILYALLTGRLPFDDKNVRTLLGKVKMGKYDMPPYLDPLAKDLLSRMLIVDVNKRITMSEVLAHPWLEGPTPGISYVPAPSVTELAQPLPSALHIDRDLFESLCVVWGRHANPDGIKVDLLSPAGEGTLAKAFYFLLLKHREKAMEEHGILMDVNEVLNSPGKVITKQYAAPRSRATRMLRRDIQSAPGSTHVSTALHPALRSSRPAPILPSRTPSPKPPPLHITIPTMEKNPSRPHLPSPVGPRPQKPRPQSSPAPPSSNRPRFPGSSSRSQSHQESSHVHSVIAGSSHRNAYTSLLPPMHRASTSSAPGTLRVPDDSTRGESSSNVIHAPTPVMAAPSTVLPMITAPRVRDAELQKTIDHYATLVNVHAANWNAAVTRDGQPAATPSVEQDSNSNSDVVMADVTQGDDKENWVGVDVVHRRTDRSGGLGFGPSVPMGKEVGNSMYATATPEKNQNKDSKDKTRHPLALDVMSPTMSQKRSNFSLIGSPTLMSPPSTSIGSPVVGEFKGWFSNLFHWKIQSYTLYSVDDPVATRNECARLLESVGVVIALEDNQTATTLKCRVDDVYDGNSLVQKQLRFRVEIQSNPAGLSSANPMSPTMNSFATAIPMRSRPNVDKLNGFETVLTFHLEKGAVSTFKLLYQHVKLEWRLGGLQSPRTVVMGGYASGMEQRLAI
ncbi:unnamed protein product [Somion occarium]|uniref:Protein kinase domain-containing protein n=1 Tax=Somion occarium TaxID=3059160 RepID=A0ABP1CUA8_9APHY